MFICSFIDYVIDLELQNIQSNIQFVLLQMNAYNIFCSLSDFDPFH